MTKSKIELNLEQLYNSDIDYDKMDIPLEFSESIIENFPNINNSVKIFPAIINKKGIETKPKSLVITSNLNKSFKTQILYSTQIQLDGIREIINNPILDKIVGYAEKVNNKNNGTKTRNQATNSKSIFE